MTLPGKRHLLFQFRCVNLNVLSQFLLVALHDEGVRMVGFRCGFEEIGRVVFQCIHPRLQIGDVVLVELALQTVQGPRLAAAKDGIHHKVNDAFCDLVEAMWAETGLHLVNASPYRSYQTQKNLYARYRTQYSEATTDRFSARAGYSEHQTGLALDVIAPGGTLNGFKNTQQFVWMRDNAHRFGFILRYGDGMEYITGYKFEPWHYRYVGVEAATFIYENDLTFEEYYAYYVKK